MVQLTEQLSCLAFKVLTWSREVVAKFIHVLTSLQSSEQYLVQ